MNDQTTAPAEDDAKDPAEELRLLKERARTLGIPIGGNVSAATLRKKIADKLAGSSEETDEDEDETEDTASLDQPSPAPRKTKAQVEQEIREKLKREKMALVRCQIYNLNPSKNDLQGEIITVANKFLGTVRKFIPFGEATDGGYHIPRVIYEDLKRRKFQQIKTRNVKGQIITETRMVPEYNVVVLPPLTREELAELATRQAAAERLGAPE